MIDRLALHRWICVWLVFTAAAAEAARQAKERPSPAGATTAAPAGEEAAGAPGAAADFTAGRLIQRAEDLFLAGEKDRGIKMLESVADQFPGTIWAHRAYLILGRQLAGARQELQAIDYLGRIRILETRDKLTPDEQEILVESLYLTGKAYYQLRQHSAAFPVLRKITSRYPNTVWANQAYYYIGMCHFAQENWSAAIEALNLVGTYVDSGTSQAAFVEAGRRLYIKVADTDLAVLYRLGQEPMIQVETASGDKEKVAVVPVSAANDLFVGSIPTVVGTPIPADGTLQVSGGEEIQSTYTDVNTQAGERDVRRLAKVKVISSGNVFFSMGDFDNRAKNAFLGQPVFVVLEDADLDRTPQADTTSIKVQSRYRVTAQDEEQPMGEVRALSDLVSEAKGSYRVRDEVALKLTEAGAGAVLRTGRFTGQFALAPFQMGETVNQSDDRLVALEGDEIFAIYTDALHAEGDVPRDVTAAIPVAAELSTAPMASQSVVFDETVRARKNLVEASAYLELARIFKDMGLAKGAAGRADEGLERVEKIITTQAPIESSLKEQAFKTKWELHMMKSDYAAAIATCQVFSELFPNSAFVDQALLGIGRIKLDQKLYAEAIQVFRQVLGLEASLAKAEAQFRIAEAVEQDPRGGREAAIPHYQTCADKYPDSEFAGPALGKLIDYYVETSDYARATDLLKQVFEDYPDAGFLDAMLLKWAVVAYRMNDFQTAHEKCTRLLFEYPGSTYTEKAKEILPKIEGKL